jgi:hypothetical protein
MKNILCTTAIVAAFSAVGHSASNNTINYPDFQRDTLLRARLVGDTLRILSIDGGGERGIIPAIVMDEFEKRTGKPISASFDLIVGTSAGAFNAAFLTKPNPLKANEPAYLASDLVKFYENDMNGLFNNTLWHKITSGFGYWGDKYPSTNFSSSIQSYFGDMKLSQTRIPVLLAAWDIGNSQLYSFTTKNAISKTENCLLWEAVAASMAYPAGFAPVKIGDGYYIDGGMAVKNPSICGIIEGQNMLREENSACEPRKKIRLVSIGTGNASYPLADAALDNEGMLQLVVPVVNLLSKGQDELSKSATEALFYGMESSYTRLDAPIDASHWVSDDVSVDMKNYLKAKAKNIIDSKEFQNLCDELK